MASEQPTTINAYIQAAPPEGQPHLNRLYEILQSIAPDAEGVIKWNTPFFVEPRFLFAFSAHKAHLGFTPSPAGLEPFRDALGEYKATKGTLKVPYNEPLPEGLIRKIAEHRLRVVSQREDGAFW